MTTRDGPLGIVLLAVGSGAAIGASIRWALSYLLNAKLLLGASPLGTWCANALGAWLIGLALGWASSHPEWPPYARLFVITGLLGGLTTFSTFSAETVALITSGAWGRALLHAALHLGGSLLLTAFGLWVWERFGA